MSMDMNELMKQAQQMQAEMGRLQKEAAAETVEASAGGGMVTVKANGVREIVSISIKRFIYLSAVSLAVGTFGRHGVRTF